MTETEWLPGQIVEVRRRPLIRGVVVGWKWSGAGKLVKIRLEDFSETTWFSQDVLVKLDAIDLLGRIVDD